MMKKIVSTVVVGLMLAGMVACSKEGPAEKAGKKVDEAVKKVKKVFD